MVNTPAEIEARQTFLYRRAKMAMNKALASSGGGHPVNPFTLFTYDIDFVAGTAKGGLQPYGSNSSDGRLFRDGTNSAACFLPPNSDGSGIYVSIGNSGLRRSTGGVWQYPSITNRLLWNRDLTNAAWVKSASMTAAKDQVGADGAANAASSLLASAADQTVNQAITLASSQVVFSFMMKRLVGTGAISLSPDGGTTYTDISAQINSSTYSQVFVTQAAVTNPNVFIKIGTSGDKIAVDFGEVISAANSMNIPKREKVATSGSTILNTQSRPTADAADIDPVTLAPPGLLLAAARQPFAFMWWGRSERGNGAGILTGIDTIFASIITNNAVTFAANGGTVQVADNSFIVGLNNRNKVAGFVDASGNMKLCVNGGTVANATGGAVNPTLDHWDLGTNGNGGRALYGVTERWAMRANLSLTDKQLQTLTT